MLLDPGSTCRSGKMLRRNFAYEIWRHFLFLRERWCHSCWLLIRTEWERRYRNVKRVTSSGLMLESYLYTLLKPILFQIINLMLCKINWLYWSTHTFPPGFLFHSFVVCLVAESPTLAHCSSYHGNSQTFPLRSRFWFTSCVSLSLSVIVPEPRSTWGYFSSDSGHHTGQSPLCCSTASEAAHSEARGHSGSSGCSDLL